MSATATVTEEKNRNGRPEVLEWMKEHEHFAGGYFEAEAVFDHELKTAAQAAARRRPAPTANEPDAPWRVEPTLAEIQHAQRTHMAYPLEMRKKKCVENLLSMLEGWQNSAPIQRRKSRTH